MKKGKNKRNTLSKVKATREYDSRNIEIIPDGHPVVVSQDQESPNHLTKIGLSRSLLSLNAMY